ncbi:hypothetical protein D2E33_04380 [Mycobacteroides abscessus]|uniref:DUF7257 domain-containing protein n=1 Tax=Mycobacteroides abscessus TaxID=36809 RepID=UPI000C264CC9|nr:hypothetical protein [Mycobacteroides abscessus]RIR62923.1 hypothetical protein D2E33_04380 [Mycobacteroides abscessus]
MSGYHGIGPIAGAYRGSDPLTAAYRGSVKLWSRNRMFDNFSGPNVDLKDTGRWADLGPSTDYRAAIVDGVMRLGMPDGLIATTNRFSRARYTVAQHSADDGYIECRAATKGNGSPPLGGASYTTILYRRANNTGTTQTHGVGIGLRESKLFIALRASSIDAEVVQCGSFGAGDIFRLKQVGNLHSMYRNGQFVGEWKDTNNLAAMGPDYRSMTVRVDASKDILGPRRFSPALDYVECS